MPIKMTDICISVGRQPTLDDVFNYIPARLSATSHDPGKCDSPDLTEKTRWRIFKRDRYNHASPNSAQTEAVCAGALDVQLAGDAWYFGVLHKKKTIGDPIRSGGTGGYPAGKPTHVRNGGDRADPVFRSVFSPILGDPVGALCKNKTEMKSIGFCREPTAE